MGEVNGVFVAYSNQTKEIAFFSVKEERVQATISGVDQVVVNTSRDQVLYIRDNVLYTTTTRGAKGDVLTRSVERLMLGL